MDIGRYLTQLFLKNGMPVIFNLPGSYTSYTIHSFNVFKFDYEHFAENGFLDISLKEYIRLTRHYDFIFIDIDYIKNEKFYSITLTSYGL